MKKPPIGRRRRRPDGATFETARRLALALPGVVEGTSYGTPGFRVRGKLIARLREDGDTLVVAIDDDEREVLLATDSKTFFLTDHYRGYPWILVRLSRVQPGDLARLLETAWRKKASRRMRADFGGGGT